MSLKNGTVVDGQSFAGPYVKHLPRRMTRKGKDLALRGCKWCEQASARSFKAIIQKCMWSLDVSERVWYTVPAILAEKLRFNQRIEGYT